MTKSNLRRAPWYDCLSVIHSHPTDTGCRLGMQVAVRRPNYTKLHTNFEQI